MDLVVALGGGDNRKVKAAQIFMSSQAGSILFTGEPESNLPKLYNKFLGIAIPDFIQLGYIFPERQSVDTIDDFRVIYDVMTQHHFTSVYIVDSSDQIARSKMIAGNILYPYFHYEFIAVPGPKGRFFSEFIALIRNFITLKTGVKV